MRTSSTFEPGCIDVSPHIQIEARRCILETPVSYRNYEIRWVTEYRVLVDTQPVSEWHSLAPEISPGTNVGEDYDIYEVLAEDASVGVTVDQIRKAYRRALHLFRAAHYNSATPPWSVSCGDDTTSPDSWTLG
jgi:hypothetical protein